MKPLRVAGYARVSTEGQAREETHEVQVAWLKAQAQLHGWRLDLFVEPGISGETIAARPQLQRLLTGVEEGRYDAVAVKAIDRLCRSQGLSDWARIADTCKRAGVKIIGGGQVVDLEDPTQALMFTVLGPGIAGFEKSMILQRTRDGMARALQAGRKPHGVDPLGLRHIRDEHRFEIVPHEAELVRRIYQLADDGRSTREIEAILAAEGITGRHGARLARSNIWRILRSTTYRGEWRFRRGVVQVPPIIEREQWDRVQTRIYSSRRRGRPNERPSPLRGLAWCARCEMPAHASNTGRSRTPYLICASNRTEHRCRGSWRRDRVLDLVWRLACQVLAQPQLFALVRDRQRGREDVAATLRAEAERLEQRRKDLATKSSGLTLRWSRGLLSDEDYDAALSALTGERRAVEARLAEVREQLRSETERTSASPEGLAAIERYRHALEHATDEQKHEVLRALCPQRGKHGVWLHHDGRVVLRGIAPLFASAPRLPNGGAIPSIPFEAEGRVGKRRYQRRSA